MPLIGPKFTPSWAGNRSTPLKTGSKKPLNGTSKTNPGGDHLKKKHNLIVGDQTAEDIKIKIGSATKLNKEEKLDISGRDLVFGLPRSVSVTSTEVTEAILPTLKQIFYHRINITIFASYKAITKLLLWLGMG